MAGQQSSCLHPDNGHVPCLPHSLPQVRHSQNLPCKCSSSQVRLSHSLPHRGSPEIASRSCLHCPQDLLQKRIEAWVRGDNSFNGEAWILTLWHNLGSLQGHLGPLSVLGDFCSNRSEEEVRRWLQKARLRGVWANACRLRLSYQREARPHLMRHSLHIYHLGHSMPGQSTPRLKWVDSHIRCHKWTSSSSCVRIPALTLWSSSRRGSRGYRSPTGHWLCTKR